MKIAKLKPGKEVSIKRKHPWIFSGAIQEMKGTVPGDWVNIISAKGEWLGVGHVGDGSIAIRVIAHWDDPYFDSVYETGEIPNKAPEVDFWIGRLQSAWSLRKSLGMGPNTATTAFRLVHGEGDRLPGLILDIYGDAAVIQAHTHGMLQSVEIIGQALQSLTDLGLKTVYNKSAAAMHLKESDMDGFVLGDAPSGKALENDLQFYVNWKTGQKTGFFLDQRDNRALLRHLSAGKTILNTFCYTGGFSVAALKGGANHVTSVDISATAMELTNQNIELFFQSNANTNQTHESVTADVLQYLKNHPQVYDIVVLDPPAFAKSRNKKHQAVMGYKRLNAHGIQCVNPGGLLFTFSCSQVIDDELFANTVTAAGIETSRNCKILYKLTQGPDHPVNLYHPEGHYLKGLVIQVD